MQPKSCIALAVCSALLCAATASAVAVGAAEADIDNFSFGPAELTVPVGTKVTWTDRDDSPHTVVDAAAQRAFRSPALDTGDHFSFVFTKAGTYHYFCSLHPFMHGTVVVK